MKSLNKILNFAILNSYNVGFRQSYTKYLQPKYLDSKKAEETGASLVGIDDINLKRFSSNDG